MEFIDRLIHALSVAHPLHAMVVHFPIAFTAAGFLFILIAIRKKQAVFEQIAFANIAMASLGTLAAGLTGLFDNMRNWGGAAPNVTVKIILAVLLLTITALTALARWRSPNLFETKKGLYVSAYLVSFPIALVIAFLGGVILYGF
ncbi:MAG: hypothetical protein MUO76_08065 [Anaerolineaceae bacterium]|nr:hypothetical protein [Anaerolineaceae bacterium]